MNRKAYENLFINEMCPNKSKKGSPDEGKNNSRVLSGVYKQD